MYPNDYFLIRLPEHEADSIHEIHGQEIIFTYTYNLYPVTYFPRMTTKLVSTLHMQRELKKVFTQK